MRENGPRRSGELSRNPGPPVAEQSQAIVSGLAVLIRRLEISLVPVWLTLVSANEKARKNKIYTGPQARTGIWRVRADVSLTVGVGASRFTW